MYPSDTSKRLRLALLASFSRISVTYACKG